MSIEPSNLYPQQMLSSPVITDPLSLGTIYNGELKVIFADADFPAIIDICRLPSNLGVYVCRRINPGPAFELLKLGVEQGSSRIPLKHPPTFCLGLLVTSVAGKDELDSLREVWSGGGEGFLPEPTFIDLADGLDAAALAVQRSLFQAVLGSAGSSAARLLTLQRQYTAFRIAHDQLQNAFDTIENFLARANIPSTWLAFACDPTEICVGPQSTEASFRLTQLLPVPSQGLAAVELHATRAEADQNAEGVLIVSIVTCEDSRPLGEWRIPYEAVPDGWMFLDLPEIDIAPRQSTLLTAIWDTRSGRPPTLSLTHLQAVPESRVRFAGDDKSRRSLALRLHIGLPGSRRIAHPFHIGVMQQPYVGHGRRLAPSVLRRFAEIDAAPNSEPMVSFLEDRGAIEVRPVNGGVTVAKLPSALPAKTRRLTATIRTEDPAGPLVEYALLALDPNDSHEPILGSGLAHGQPGGFSGWLPIHPDFTTQIHLNLTEPAVKPLDLYLATRLVKGQATAAAQARWLEFVVDAFHEALTA